MTDKDGLAFLRLTHLRSTLSTSVWMLMLLFGVRAAHTAEPTIHFDLPAQDFVSAVLEFNRQSGVQTLYGYDPAAESVDSIRTSSVVGNFTVAEALTRMLNGTGFSFRFTPANAIVLFRVSTPHQSGAEPPAQPQSSPMGFVPASYLTPIDEVYVTGTRLRGALDVVSPTVILPNKELRRSTFATVQDAMYMLPLNSLSGPREDWGTSGNAGYGAGINLRHLGAGATLVLVNGHRQPVSGENGTFTDVSNIPWSAVERIEIVPDGNSALYGSDAIAGVVNIIMRDDVDGAESQARFTSVSGGANELQASQLFGKDWTSGHALLAYQYAKRAPLAAADREYVASADKRPLGGTDHRTYYASPGNIIDPATLQPVLGIPATGIHTANDYSPSINLANRFEQTHLLPERRTHNLFLTATQAFGERWIVRADGRYGVRDTIKRVAPAQQLLVVPRSNPFYVDPFPDRPSPSVLVAYSFLRDFGGPATYTSTTRVATGAISATRSMGSDWRLTLSQSYGREQLQESLFNLQDPAALQAALYETDPARAFNPFGHTAAGVFSRIRRTVFGYALSEIATTSTVADGTLHRLPSGAVKFAIGAEYRRESFDFRRFSGASGENQRNVGSGFAELAVPLIGNPNDARAAPRLEFTAAGRYEDYSDFSRTLNPRLGLKWAPSDEFKLRASWGQSFRAPTLVDRETNRNLSGIASLVDPKSSSGRSVIVGLSGNNPDVQEETAATWTAGFDFVPLSVPGLKLSLTYFDMDYGNRIVTPAENAPSDILLQEEQWASVINRHPTPAQIDAVCQRTDFFGPATCAQAQPNVIVDFRKMNLAETEVKGLDAAFGRKWSSRIGSLDLQLMGSYLLEFRQRNSPTAPFVSVLNTVNNPSSFRLRAWGDWSQHPEGTPGFRAAAAVNYSSSYRDTDRAPSRSVRSWTTMDLLLGYRASSADGWLADMEVMINAVNVLDNSPPFVNREDGYDVANAQPIGRAISLEVRKNW